MKYRFIESAVELEKTCRELMQEKIIGVDLEADAMHRFHEKICLIQLATQHHAYLIDPFKIENMSAFKALLAAKDVIKVFHGSDFDIRSLDRDYGARVNNLSDTEIACRFLGIRERGLATLLKQYFNIHLDKKYQKKDWSKRPLDPEMIAYSVMDVAFLVNLHHTIHEQLAQKKRLEWAREEYERQAGVRYKNNHTDPLFRKFKGAGKLDNRTLAVLETLLQLRLSLAQTKDKPLFRIFSNKRIMAMATQKPETLEQIHKLKMLGKRQADMYGNECVKAIVYALKIPHRALPGYPGTRRIGKDESVQARIRQLKKMRVKLSRIYAIEAGFLLNNAVITAIALENPFGIDDLKQIDMMRKWQVQIIGNDIIKHLNDIRSGRR